MLAHGFDVATFGLKEFERVPVASWSDLTGETGNSNGFSPELLMEVSGLPCYVADDPPSCVAVGAGPALAHGGIRRDHRHGP